MFNYPLEQTEINQIFDDVMSQAICESGDIVTGDFNSDCVVDIDDLAILTQNWMTSNRVPVP
jgi:hypothetical protein